jgi:hypothetical protein
MKIFCDGIISFDTLKRNEYCPDIARGIPSEHSFQIIIEHFIWPKNHFGDAEKKNKVHFFRLYAKRIIKISELEEV